ncbi:tyrosinase family protein [Streptomyces antibioticus]|uniref:Tyrosinase n=1 Tax=Streptomyces antibioticus TaxID=1890 RepID=A0AAE7CKN2_STRAT|nr:tyrosinase family protein [Streptomyces antibioticus]MCX4739089.1 tyrosinase family protein [Streptomyces antibioticus]MCX5169135.1 tyrosinase family protein [Streptomyces antibioticus]OOQ52088.1 tyrosinase [Streptomyces antibioticus]QIT44602.1 tyrosinase family protein [Streptomyces antibioticus]
MVYTRKDVTTLTATERRRFVNALLEIKRRGVYDEFVRMHINYYVSDGEGGLRTAHMAPSFLPWHRRFLLDLENALRRVDSSVTVPYWDWTRARSKTAAPWTKDLLGGNGRASDRQVTTGPFAYSTGNWTLKENITDGRFLTRDLGRAAAPIELPLKSDVEWALSDPVYDVSPWDSTSTKGFRNKLEGWGTGRGSTAWRTHNRVHRWVGGEMLGGASVNDPVFWLHHAYIDLVWTRWQQRHREHRYLPAEPPGPGSRQHRRVVARKEKLPPWNLTPDQLEDMSGVYRYA